MTDKEKLKKIKELADAMYVKMQNLTTDTSGIRKAMEEYRQFIINEYNKEDPVIEDLEEVSKKYSSCIYLEEVLSDDDKEVLKERLINNFKAGAKWQKEKGESTTEDLGEYLYELSKQFPEVSFAKLSRIGVRVAKWQKEHLLKTADGDDLPGIDREVIALLDNGKVVYAHRPSEYWDGKNIATGKVTRYYPKTYDNGGWNIPNVKYWLDVKLPKEIEL